MYLKKLWVKNFRCIKDVTIDLNEGVNILIGENNSGKTAILDALRISLSYGKQWRDIYVSLSDFHIDKNDPNAKIGDIEFHLYFEVQKEEETGIYNDLLSVVDDKGKKEFQLHFRYFIEERKGNRRLKYKVWGGDNEGQSVAPEVLDLIYFVHLDALRDAVQHLRPIRGNRLGELYAQLVMDDKKQDALAKKVRSTLGEDKDWTELIKQGKEKVNEHLNETTIRGKEQTVEIDFLPFEFRRIVDNLRVQTPVYSDTILEKKESQKYFELHQNGLGYNNLIYVATVLGDLKRRKEVSGAYVSLLIEEPEAHLHPQLQKIFFSYLNTLNKIGFQIFVTSHSPTITAKAALDSLIVLQEQNGKITSLSMKKSDLGEPNKTYLGKFLDVTKSQLFFSNGVILVEGISEALLLPVFSRIMGDKYDIEKKGVEIVNVNGVAFEHFGKLFNSDNNSNRLSCRCTILTDDDRPGNEEISSRAEKAKELEKGLLRVSLAEKTFEYELFKAGSNSKTLLEIFKSMHPIAAKKINPCASIEEQADSFLEKLTANKAKSELSHNLAVKLAEDVEARKNFTVPEYIKAAIKWVSMGE